MPVAILFATSFPGTPLPYLLSCEGCLCYEYDHIVPWSKNGPSTAENCQILQTRVNRFKGAQEDVDQDTLLSFSCARKWKDPEELDLIELALWGDIIREERRCRIPSLLEQFQEATDIIYLNRHRQLPPCD